jgi:hypothetical protein
MLNRTAQALSANRAIPDNETSLVIHNALLESFLVHARSLIEFLYSADPRPDDVAADDFFDDASVWRRERSSQTDLMMAVPRRVGKEIAHLTYSRLGVAPEQKTWSAMQIAVDIEARLSDFEWMLPARFAKPVRPEFASADQAPGPVTEVGSKGRSGYG